MPPGEPEDTVIQMYTSGTTGIPKGVELSNRNILALMVAAEEGGWGKILHTDVGLMCMPASHVAGTAVGLVGLVHGSAVVVMAEFDPAALIEASPAFFAQNATDARTALATIANASDVVRRLLEGGHSAIAGRLAAALRNIGRERIATDIVSAMKAAA